MVDEGRTIPSSRSLSVELSLSAPRTACSLTLYETRLKQLKHSKGSAWEKHFEVKKKRTNKILIFSIFIPAVKVIHNKVYVAIIIFKKIIRIFFTVSWHFDTKYPLGYLHRKRYFSSNKTSLYCGLQQNKTQFWRNNGERIA